MRFIFPRNKVIYAGPRKHWSHPEVTSERPNPYYVPMLKERANRKPGEPRYEHNGWELSPNAFDRAIEEARAKRDRLLADSDWVTIRATDMGDPVPTEWQTYRQALRDIPEQTGFPEEIEWPQEPES